MVRKWRHPDIDLDQNMWEVEKILAQHSMLATKYYLRHAKINLEVEWNEDQELLFLVSRDREGLGPRETVVLSPKTAFGLAVMVRGHDQNHLRSLTRQLDDIRKLYHIPQVEKLN